MDKLTGLTGISAILKQAKSQNSDKSKKGSRKVSDHVSTSFSHSLADIIRAYSSKLDSVNDDELIDVFIRSVLILEFGDGIESDKSYMGLMDKLSKDIQNHSDLKKQIITIMKGIDSDGR